MTIPFVQDFDFAYGRCERLSLLVSRVIADNPGSFTFTGTGTYVVGRDAPSPCGAGPEVVVIDPGPPCDAHLAALKAATGGARVAAVLVTHSHMDHSPLAEPFARWAGCEVHAGGPGVPTASEVRMEAGDDLAFRPDETIGDGWAFSGPGWTLRAVETPGHTSNHLCFWLEEERALFSGDHVMGWSTSVVSPPDGDMGRYVDSLRKVRALDPGVIYPSHGAPITDEPARFIDAYTEHRLARERAILAVVRAGRTRVREVVADLYAEVDKRLHPAAAHSVLAHLIHLYEQELVRGEAGRPQIHTETYAV